MIKRFLLASLAIAPFCDAAVTTRFRDVKRHLQQAESGIVFAGGGLSLSVVDGGFTLGPCFHPTFEIYGPSIGCPAGTKGLIAVGDIDQDGVRDEGTFWSVTAVNGATQVEPFRTDRVRILAAPPSGIADILRSTGGDIGQIFEVNDTSTIIWWDVLGFPIQQYNITSFDGARPYGSGSAELSRQFWDLPWGNYLFSYPLIDNPQTPLDDLFQLNFGVTHNVSPDVYPGRGVIPTGWRINGPDDVWATYDLPLGEFSIPGGDTVTVEGALEIDPKNFFQIAWTGITTNNAVATDQLFFSIVGNYPDAEGDILETECMLTGGPDKFGIIFPPYSPCTPESDRDEVLIGTFDGRVDMPPFFFSPGDVVFAHLRFVRQLPAGGQTFDNSQRSIYIPISMVENWDSFATFTAPFSAGGFPFGTPRAERTRLGDFDGDFANNLTEFALNTDVNDKDDVPPIVTQETVPQGTLAGECGGTLMKRPYLSSTIRFTYQHSPNGTTWFTISPTDPDWSITTVITDLDGNPLDLDVDDIDGDGDTTEVFVNGFGNFTIDNVEYFGPITEMVTVVNEVDLAGDECFFRVVITD